MHNTKFNGENSVKIGLMFKKMTVLIKIQLFQHYQYAAIKKVRKISKV